MSSRREEHETLSLPFVRDLVPPACRDNNTKEVIQGKFYQNWKDAAHQLKELGPYSPWSNATEKEIKKVKRGACHKLLWSRAPKCLWEKFLDLEACIGSNTAKDIYKLHGKVIKTLMSGEILETS